MVGMATETLELMRRSTGYYITTWYDDQGQRHQKSFGKDARKARTRFSQFHAEWRRDPRLRSGELERPTVREVWERFEEWARDYYRSPEGEPTGESENLTLAVRELLSLYGDHPAEEMGPRDLIAVRDAMIAAGLCRNEVNKRARKVRQVFRWATTQELVPASVWHGMQAVQALQPGRSGARETAAVTGVADAWIEAVIVRLPPTLAAMVRLQSFTGMRPGEVCSLRPIDVDTSGKLWIYRPLHKTRHLGKLREVFIGPRGQDVLRPWLTADVEAFCFNPLVAQRERFATCKTHRHQDVIEPETDRRIRDRYEPATYARAIARACTAADVPHWSPNQLRHGVATRLRREFGLEVAQAVLGHASADTTELYAEIDRQRAIAAMEQVG